jgi:hypothetical protein
MVVAFSEHMENLEPSTSPRAQPRVNQRRRSHIFPRAIRFIDVNQRKLGQIDISHAVREGIRIKNWRSTQRLHSYSARSQLGELKWRKISPKPSPSPRLPTSNEEGSSRSKSSGRRLRTPRRQTHGHGHSWEPKPTRNPSMGRQNKQEDPIFEQQCIPTPNVSPFIKVTKQGAVALYDPRNLLREDSIDPFANLPVRVNSKIRELTYHCECPPVSLSSDSVC